MPYVRRMLVSDIDNTLLGDRAALDALIRVLRTQPRGFGFGVATGRHAICRVRSTCCGSRVSRCPTY